MKFVIMEQTKDAIGASSGDACNTSISSTIHSLSSTKSPSLLNGLLLILVVLCGESVAGVGAFCPPRSTFIPRRPATTQQLFLLPSPPLFRRDAVPTYSSRTAMRMGRPGQSEAQQRQEREEEIRSKLAKLKSSGKMKGGTSESMMDEAEQFFNKETRLKKFERRAREREQREADEGQKENDETKDGDTISS
jgi:hypothetical protein